MDVAERCKISFESIYSRVTALPTESYRLFGQCYQGRPGDLERDPPQTNDFAIYKGSRQKPQPHLWHVQVACGRWPVAVSVGVRARARKRVCACVCMRAQVQEHVHVHAHVHVHVHVRVHVQVHVHVHVNVHVHVQVHVQM